MYKKQVIDSIKKVGPKVVTINDNANQISEEPKCKKRTFAYITRTINGRKVNIIVDTGVEFNLITKNLADELRIDLDRPVSTPMKVVNGQKSIPLGELDDIPITLGSVTILINAVVTTVTSYQVILGN